MPLSDPPIQEMTTMVTGRFPRSWISWFLDVKLYLSGQVPIVLASYTVAGVPDASINTGAIIYVSNESGGAVPAFSDGTNWRRVTDRAIIT